MPQRQEDAAGGDAVRAEAKSQLLGGLLAALVGIDVEGEIDSSRALAQLAELICVEMCAQRAGDVLKARLP